MLQKKPWIVPIPGTRHLCRLKENAGAVDIKINPAEINQIDTALDHMDMSEVFGGTKSNNSQAYNPPHEGIRLLVETIFLIFWLYNNIYIR